MADIYVPSKASSAFADISAFTGDGNAINAATKTALNTALGNISALLGSVATNGAPHPDFNKVSPDIRAKVQNELAVLQAAVTAHA